MIHNVAWIDTKVSKRDKGIQHLKQFTELTSKLAGFASHVAANITNGSINRLILVGVHDTLPTSQSDFDRLAQTDEFAAWYAESIEIFNWESAEQLVMRSIRQGNASADWWPTFIQAIELNVIPGQMAEARAFLSKYADHIESTYGHPVSVFCNEGGAYYGHTVFIGFDTLEQYEAMQAAMQSDAAIAQFASEMLPLFDSATLQTAIGQYL